MQFNYSNIPLINFGQQVVSSTIGTNIGINNITGIIQSMFNSIRTLTDKTQVGGGIRDENIAVQGITNISTDLTMETVKQAGEINTNAGTQELVTVINTSVVTNKPNTKIHITWSGRCYPVVNSTTGEPAYSASRPRFVIEISTSPTFSSILATDDVSMTGTQHNANNTIGADSWFWHGQTGTSATVFTLSTTGTYYIRLRSGHSGNYVQTSRATSGKITYHLN